MAGIKQGGAWCKKKIENKNKIVDKDKTKKGGGHTGILNNIKQKLPSIRNTKNTKYNIQTTRKHHTTTNTNNTQILYQAMKNKDVYKCLTVYKNTALACGFNIDTDTVDNDNATTKNYLERLFNNPEGYHTRQTWSSTNSLIWDSFLGLGDCFFEVSTDNNLNTLNGFKYIHNDALDWSSNRDCYYLKETPNVTYEPNELIHIYEPNPERDKSMWGVSRISRCADYIALATNALKYNNTLLENDGVNPNIVVIFNDGVSDDNMQYELNRLAEAKRQNKNSWIALKNAQIQQLAYTNRDMNYLELMKYARDNIIQTFGVPPQLAGIIESANLGSGSGDSQKKDWKITFDGVKCFVEDAFNETLKYYGFTERFHYQEMDVIDELYDAQVAQYYIQNGIKTVDEVRNEMGLDKKPHNLWERYL